LFATAGQAAIFLATVYGGLATGLLYDALGAARRAFKLGPLATGALDFLFWLAGAGLLALSIALSGGDGLRAYMLLGFAAGAVLYAAGVHRLIAWAVERVLEKAEAYRKEIEKKENSEKTDQSEKAAQASQAATPGKSDGKKLKKQKI